MSVRYHPLPPSPADGSELCLEFQGLLRSAILAELSNGPVQSFGSRRCVDKALRSLKKEGYIRFTSKVRGGNGWERVKP